MKCHACIRTIKAYLFAVLALTFGLTLAQAQTYNVLHHFTGGKDGANPIAGLTIDSEGILYGTASAGGTKSFGTVYRLVPSGSGWAFSLLYTFQGQNDGSAPYAGVVFGPDGKLYGTTHSGGGGQGCKDRHGCGTVFQVKPRPGTVEIEVFRFGTDDGSNPVYGDLVFDQAGNMYGTTQNGGANLQGAVYELSPNGVNWTETVVYSFAGTPDGASPLDGPVLNHAGNLYGTTSAGGASGWGTVYELTPTASGWTENVLHSFQNGSDGLTPTGNVLFDQSGRLYGATQAGGTGGGGTVFELTPSGETWSLNTLYDFSRPTLGEEYRTLIMDKAGNLYGTNSGDGVTQQGSVFKLTQSNGVWTYSSLHDFTGGIDGGAPYGRLVFDAEGNIYGTASTGGAYGNGVLFEIMP